MLRVKIWKKMPKIKEKTVKMNFLFDFNNDDDNDYYFKQKNKQTNKTLPFSI